MQRKNGSFDRAVIAGLALLVLCALVGCQTIGKGSEDGFITEQYEGKSLSALGLDMRLLADRSETGAFEAVEGTWPPDGGFAPHTHEFGEGYYVVDGAMTVKYGDIETVASKGSFGFVPAGMVHSWTNESSTTPFRMILFFIPSFGSGYAELMDKLGRMSPEDPEYMAKVAVLFKDVGKTEFVR